MSYIIFLKYPVDNSCPILIILLSIKPEYNIQKYVFFSNSHDFKQRLELFVYKNMHHCILFWAKLIQFCV